MTEKPIYIHESQVGMFTSACGNCVYTGGNFPLKYENAYFVCEPVHNLVHSDILIGRGVTFAAKRALNEAEFLASTDSWFKPVFITVGPDGGLYVVDYYRKHVEHPDYIPEGMEDRFDLREGEGRGRIYRVIATTSRPTPRPRLKEATSADLVSELSNPNLWWRITAQRLLVERQDRSVLSALEDLARTGATVEGLIHALWTLEGLGRLEADQILQSLDDDRSAVREQAIRLSEKVLSDSIQSKLLEMTDDPDDRVLFRLACTLGLLPDEKSFPALKKIITRYMDDPWFRTAVLSAASKAAMRWFRTLSEERGFLQEESEGKGEFLKEIAAIIGARQRSGEIAEILTFVEGREETRGRWWQAASLKGLADGLKRGAKRRIGLSVSAGRALLRLLQSPSPRIGSAALDVAMTIELADSPKLRASLKKAAEIALGSAAELESRVNAVRMLGLDRRGGSIPLLTQLLSPQQPVRLQVAAATVLLDKADSRLTEILLKKWGSYPVPVREVVLRGFFDDPTRLHALLDAVEGESVQPWTLSRSSDLPPGTSPLSKLDLGPFEVHSMV